MPRETEEDIIPQGESAFMRLLGMNFEELDSSRVVATFEVGSDTISRGASYTGAHLPPQSKVLPLLVPISLSKTGGSSRLESITSLTFLGLTRRSAACCRTASTASAESTVMASRDNTRRWQDRRTGAGSATERHSRWLSFREDIRSGNSVPEKIHLPR
jgi:hypothetical protein